jgi:hypothetical protein
MAKREIELISEDAQDVFSAFFCLIEYLKKRAIKAERETDELRKELESYREREGRGDIEAETDKST